MDLIDIIFSIAIFLCGALVVAKTLFSAIETFVVPRSNQDILTRIVFQSVRVIFHLRLFRNQKYEEYDRIMAYYAPVSLMALLPTWYTLIMFGYTLMFWATGISSFYEAFRVSVSSIVTLGFADVDGIFRTLLAFSEAIIGLLLVALLISYLPTIYAAFQRRETPVTLLDARAGNPPSPLELIKRYHRIHGLKGLSEQWEAWESWFADLEESHTSLPVLVFFRSPQAGRSWVTAAGTVLDAASLALSTVDIPRDPKAALCIRAGFIALRRVADIFRIRYNPDPKSDDPIQMTRQEFDDICKELVGSGVPLKADRNQAWRDFSGWRVNYETVLLALIRITMSSPVTWMETRQNNLHT